MGKMLRQRLGIFLAIGESILRTLFFDIFSDIFFDVIFLNCPSKFEYFIASPSKFPFQEGSSLQDLSMDNLNPPDLNSGEKPPRVLSFLFRNFKTWMDYYFSEI